MRTRETTKLPGTLAAMAKRGTRRAVCGRVYVLGRVYGRDAASI